MVPTGGPGTWWGETWKVEAGGQEPRPPGETLPQDEEGAAKALGGRMDWRESAVLLPSPCV